jgi:hypothetical protein
MCRVVLIIFCWFLFQGCGGNVLPVCSLVVTATNNNHRPILFSELSDITASEHSFTGNFVFQNISSSPLQIELKITNCGCLSLKKDEQALKQGGSFTIPAKEKVTLSMTMQMPHYPGKNQYGATFTVHCEDQEFEQEIFMACPVYDDIVLDIQTVQVSFDRNTVSDSFSICLTRSAHEKSELSISPAAKNLPSHVTLKKVTETAKAQMVAEGIWQKEWRIDFVVKIPKDSEISPLPQPMTLTLGKETAEWVLIIMKSYGVDAPKNVDFPDTFVTKKRSFVFSLQSATDMPFAIESAACDDSNFSVLMKQNEGIIKQHWIEVVFQPTTEGEHKAVLFLKTSHADAEAININLQGIAIAEEQSAARSQ